MWFVSSFMGFSLSVLHVFCERSVISIEKDSYAREREQTKSVSAKNESETFFGSFFFLADLASSKVNEVHGRSEDVLSSMLWESA